MKKLTSIPALLAVLAMFFLGSCSKDNSVLPATEATNTPVINEIDLKQPAPGTYKVSKFIDTGDDETAQFNGYTFTFKANGGLTATTASGHVFNGSWSLNSAETIMTINIAGNNALKDLDDDNWQVVRITNQTIKITKNGPDTVVFTKI